MRDPREPRESVPVRTEAYFDSSVKVRSFPPPFLISPFSSVA